jgi:GH25 family lysozyme M1 (1,4-beta-N-acetylmuramidase)
MMTTKRFFFLLFSVLFWTAQFAFAQSSIEFNQPWTGENKAILIDPYQGNDFDWDKLQTDKRVAGIIHRATIGDRADTKYSDRRAEAKRRGYLWGSYHLGKTGDPVVQADFYLRTAKPIDDELIALDIEGLESPNMSLENAVKFINRIKEKTGRFPVLYANQAVVSEISRRYKKTSVFSQMPLWYARFKSVVTDFPKQTWTTYTIWQFASEINCAVDVDPDPKKEKWACNQTKPSCPYRVAGTDRCMDVNVYYGTVEDLKLKFPFTRK